MNGVADAEKPGGQVESVPLWQKLAEFLVVGVCVLAFVFTALDICTAVLERNTAGTRDFVEYWASGQQLRHHADPYDRKAILAIERSVGYPHNSPALVMPNPPTALALVYPLGFLGPGRGEFLWTLMLLASLVASVQMVWRMHGSPRGHLEILGYTFAPALACMAAGQMSLFVLLGLVLFLRFHQSRPFLAGASLWLCALKPHLFLPIGLVLLAWMVASKCYKVLFGAAGAFALSTAIAFVLDPLAWTHYSQMMRAMRVDKLPIPCLSNLFRRSISPDTVWLQYLPAAIGCIWAILYFRRHRGNWDWMAHGSPLMLVSVLAAPYSWFIDQAILIPALLHGVLLTRSRGLIAALALASAVIEIGPLRGLPVLQSPFYLWTAPAWLAWYLVATRGVASARVGQGSQSARTTAAMTEAGLVAQPVPSAWPKADEVGQ
ncbi:MAG: glycosyltransferase family 87 protein [Acidobacteriaceae bacterium]|jgi:hypothetical protein